MAPTINPLHPLELIGGPCRSNTRLFFDTIIRKWRVCEVNSTNASISPYSCLLHDHHNPAVQVISAPAPEYIPLSGPREIRLLAIYPGSQRSGLLRCFLVHVSLNDLPPYIALSYTWGLQTGDKKPIILDGKVLQIGKNLQHAIKRLQHADHLEFVWADALCINQEDKAEKSTQVSMMRDIYNQARLTFAWLGEHEEDSELAVSEIKRLGKIFWQIEDEGALLERTGEPPVPAGSTMKAAIEKAASNFLNENSDEARFAAYEAMAKLMCRPYFERVWTQQEMITPRYMAFACGDGEVFGTLELIAVWQVFRRYKVSNDKLYCKHPGENLLDRAIMLLLLSLPENKHKARLTNLIVAQDLRASDPRDHVYALLGMAIDAGSYGIKIDYLRPVELVYTDLIESCVKQGNLDLIACSQFPKKINNLPSWVPDWTSSIRLSLPGVVLDPENYIRFKASGSNPVKAEVVFENGTPVLRITGIRLGSVAFVGENWSTRSFDDNVRQNPAVISLELLHDISQLIQAHAPAASEQLVKDISYEMLRSADPNTPIYYTDGSENLSPDTSLWESFEALVALRDLLEKPVPENLEDQIMADFEILQANTKSKLFCSSATKRILDHGCRLFVTSDGFFGLGPGEVEVDDIACVMFGADVPYILRPLPQSHFRFLGTTYVREVMEGDAVAAGLLEESFELE